MDILVVDDDLIDRRAISRALDLMPGTVNVAEAHSAADADILVRGQSFDCLIVDYVLPGEDGLSLARRLLASTEISIKAVIMLTGEGDEAIAVEAMKLGVRDYLVKDFEGKYLESLSKSVVRAVEVGQLVEAKEKAEEDLMVAKLEAEISREEAEIANRAKSGFLANVSHELRTPLNAIIGFSEIMTTELFGQLGNDKYAGYAVNIHDSGKHLLDVVNDLLDISKIEAGERNIVDTAIDLPQILDQLRDMMAPKLDEKNISFSLPIDENVPQLIADEVSFRQIILNLLSNAIKFTPAEGEISIAVTQGHDQSFCVSVHDNGIGIKAEDIDTVLAPFGQASDAMVAAEGGTGLGLSITNSLMELHDGSLKIRSEPGRYTTVHLYFPPSRTGNRIQQAV
jgi:signal transduction histidine kinase